MKQKKYGILMFVGIAVMVLMPFAPCRADWEWYDWEGSSPSPLSGNDDGEGDGYTWEWSYEITNKDCGGTGDEDGGQSWAVADIVANEEADVSQYNGETVTADPDTPEDLEVIGSSFFADVYPYTEAGVDLEWDISTSGTVEVRGSVYDENLGSGDTVYSTALASAVAGSWVNGYGGAWGEVEENNIEGSADTSLGGEATEDNPPIAHETEDNYHAKLEFSVDAYDSENDVAAKPGPYSFTATSVIAALADAYATLSVSEGYTGNAWAVADVEFSGYAILSVDYH